MKMLHDNGYSNAEKEAFKEIIYSNVVQSMKVLLEAMDRIGIQLGESNNQLSFDLITKLPRQLETFALSQEVFLAVKKLWADSGVQKCYERANEFQLNDSAN